MNNLENAYNLLHTLNIKHIRVFKDHFELQKDFVNQRIIAYGNTEEEVIENFYHLYQELQQPS